ncbi:MAG: PIN domain-containing protein [Actinomycetota bacterium]|jgi:predicted nucleic acid-binding protein|nr:PIN domain-containing protein [Actinomycetota bacterium]
MSDELTFVDSNVLVYAYDADAGSKHEKSRAVVEDLWRSRTGSVSTQVLQEFYVVATRKLVKPLPRLEARAIVATYKAWPVHRPTVDDVTAASELEERHQVQFWDALVVTSALRLGASTLLSEDLQQGQHFSGLVVVNPFASAA